MTFKFTLKECLYWLSVVSISSSSTVATAQESNPVIAAATNKNPVQTVEISAPGKLSTEQTRQQDTSMRSIYSEQEWQKYSAQSVAEVLKHLPGITVTENKAKGIEIRMRGLGNGYTQILLNGEVTAADVGSIAPELIERIEVIRVASAELNAQAIAGTINIVLKKKPEKASHELRVGLGGQTSDQTGEKLSPSLTLNLSDRLGNYPISLQRIWKKSNAQHRSDS